MTDANNRSVDAEIDFNSDGSAYFSWAIYIDTGEACDDATLDYLDEMYPEELHDAEFDRYLMQAEAAYEGDR